MGYIKSDSGFIVHPANTGNNKYHASYGKNNNRTNRSFNTLQEAKNYLKKHNIKKALYDSPTRRNTLSIVSSTKRKRRIKHSSSGFFGSSRGSWPF